jgi:hypothetical protein
MPDRPDGSDPAPRFERRGHGGLDEQGDASRRIGELRRMQPGDATLKNLLALLTAKLELCEGLPVWEWEAGNEGHRERAAGFRALAADERRACMDIMEWLREHLERRAATTTERET